MMVGTLHIASEQDELRRLAASIFPNGTLLLYRRTTGRRILSRGAVKVGMAEIILSAVQGKKFSILAKCFPRQ